MSIRDQVIEVDKRILYNRELHKYKEDDISQQTKDMDRLLKVVEGTQIIIKLRTV